MVMDLGHSAKRTNFVFFTPTPPRPATALGNTPAARAAIGFCGSTPRLVRVRWYFAPEGALPVPGGTIWGSTDWDSIYERAGREIGEVPRSGTSKANSGLPPLGAGGQHYCGRPVDFLEAKVWDPLAPLPHKGPGGLLLCCNRALSASIAFFGGRPTANTLGLTSDTPARGEIGLTDRFVPTVADGQIALTSESSARGDIGLTSDRTADGWIGMTDRYVPSPAEGEIALTSDTPADGAMGLTQGSGESAGGDVGLGGAEDVGGGEMGLTAPMEVGEVGGFGLGGEVPAIGIELGMDAPEVATVVTGGATCAAPTVIALNVLYETTVPTTGTIWFLIPSTSMPAIGSALSSTNSGLPFGTFVTYGGQQGCGGGANAVWSGISNSTFPFSLTAGFPNELEISFDYVVQPASMPVTVRFKISYP